MHPLSILPINTHTRTRVHTHTHTIEAQIAMKHLICGTKKCGRSCLFRILKKCLISKYCFATKPVSPCPQREKNSIACQKNFLQILPAGKKQKSISFTTLYKTRSLLFLRKQKRFFSTPSSATKKPYPPPPLDPGHKPTFL